MLHQFRIIIVTPGEPPTLDMQYRLAAGQELIFRPIPAAAPLVEEESRDVRQEIPSTAPPTEPENIAIAEESRKIRQGILATAPATEHENIAIVEESHNIGQRTQVIQTAAPSESKNHKKIESKNREKTAELKILKKTAEKTRKKIAEREETSATADALKIEERRIGKKMARDEPLKIEERRIGKKMARDEPDTEALQPRRQRRRLWNEPSSSAAM